MWGIEIIQFQEFFKDVLVERSRERMIPVPARGIRSSDDKDLRILSLQPHCANGTIRLHKSQTVLIEQLTHYPEADHNDGPDALQMLYMLAYSGLGSVIPRIKSGKRKVSVYGS